MKIQRPAPRPSWDSLEAEATRKKDHQAAQAPAMAVGVQRPRMRLRMGLRRRDACGGWRAWG
ncbi:MAG: hypothetical protein H6814_06480 [Phycisphaeraceae bacterium]|nr:hypothetical protein [Phycisphaeraceae bacterium]